MRKYYTLLSIATLPLATLLLGTGCALINPGTTSIVEAESEGVDQQQPLAEIVVADATNEFNLSEFGLDQATLATLTPNSRELVEELKKNPDMNPLLRRQFLAVIRMEVGDSQRGAASSQRGGEFSPADPVAGTMQEGTTSNYFANADTTQIGAPVDMSTVMLQQMGREVSDGHLRRTDRRPSDTYVGPEPNKLPVEHNPAYIGDRGAPLPPPIPDMTPAIVPAGYNAPSNDKQPPAKELEWTEHLAKTRATLYKTLETAGHLTDDEKARMQATLRIVDLLEGRKETALEPVLEYDEDLRQYLTHQLQTLSVMLDPAGIPIPERRAAVALRSLRTAERFLSNHSQLDLENVSFCEAVNGYGDISEFPSNTFAADQRTLLYVEIRNMTEQENGDGFETELQGSYEIFDATGHRVANRTLPLERGRCSNFRRDYYIAYLIYMPQRIQAGEHTLQLTIEDLKGKKFGQATVAFTLRQ